MIDRRDFVLGSLAAAAAAACSGKPEPAGVAEPVEHPKPVAAAPVTGKKILILGGTNFIGPHIVRAALARGHTVTLFNRGKTHAELFPELEKLRGDRDGHLEALANRKWDAVVDPSGFVPRIVKASAELLAPNVGFYVFISTITVYERLSVVGDDESAPLRTIADPTDEDSKTHYGELKALCEKAAEAAMPGRVATLRPGLIVGPGDLTGRFSHWPSRLAAGGEVIGPGDGTTPVQWIDARDLAAWIIKVIEDRSAGTFNAFGPEKRTTIKEVLDACNTAGGNKATITWVDAKFLEKQGVHGWTDLPMWIDNTDPDALGFGTAKNARAFAKGLTCRPVLDTAKDTLAWLATLSPEERAKVGDSGIKRDRELAVLAAWKARKTGT
jgi:2'-hydroxyisoflavone reductase